MNNSRQTKRTSLVGLLGTALLILCAGLSQTSLAATFNVNTTIDELDGSCSDGDCSIRDAIALANAAPDLDTINISAGTYQMARIGVSDDEDTNATDDFDIIYPVNIIGAGETTTIIQGENSTTANRRYRVFHFQLGAAGSSISNLTVFQGGNEWFAGNGGGIYSVSSLDLTNVTLKDNRAVTGGGLYIAGGTAVLDNVNFEANYVGAGGGGGLFSGATLTLQNGSTFLNNYISAYSTVGANGGDILSTGNLTATNTTFTGRANFTAYFGGSIHITGASLSLVDSTFSNYQTWGLAGAIYMEGGTMTNVSFTGNIGSTGGGAIYNAGNTLTINRTGASLNVFSQNKTQANANTKNGGAIYSAGNLNISYGDFDGLVTGDDAYHGAAIYVDTLGTLTIDNSTFDSFEAYSLGGAIYMNSGTLSDVTFNDNWGNDSGGAIYNASGSLTINGTSNQFNRNYSGGTTATDYGGTIYSAGTTSIANATFVDRTANTTNDAYVGGALYSVGAVTISDSSFDSFEVFTSGGAIYTGAGGTLTNVVINDSYAAVAGGAIYSASGTLIINESGGITSFTGNYCGNNANTKNGGSINSQGNLEIYDADFVGRSASTAHDAYWGGAIYAGGTATIARSTFDNFESYVQGGAIYLATGGTLTDVTLTNNHSNATGGGGIHNASGALVINGTKNTFTNNDGATGAGDNGGAILMAGGSLTMTNTTISDSTAYLGGGIYSNAGATLSIKRSLFSGNSTTGAGTDGGAIYANDGLTVANTTFSGNTAIDQGAGIVHLGTAACNIYSSTFYNNNAGNATGKDAILSTVCTLYGSIVQNITNENDMCDVASGGFNTQYDGDATATCFTNSGTDFTRDPQIDTTLTDNGGATLTHALIISPLSISIDAGNNTVCSNTEVGNVDQRGRTRPADGDGNATATCDMGAYEYISSTNTAPVGGYSTDNILPLANIVQATNGSGVMTITFKGRDAENTSVTITNFAYSINGGTNWITNSTALGGGAAGSYTVGTTFGGDLTFTFDSRHADVQANFTGANALQQDVRFRFTLNDGAADSALIVATPTTSFTIDNEAPTATISSSIYTAGNNTLVITGTNFDTIAAISTDIKTYVDWTKFVWDINGDNAASADISFVVGDITSLTVTNATTLTMVLTPAKATTIEGNASYGGINEPDTLDISAGFARDAAGNAASTDAAADAALETGAVTYIVTKATDTLDGACTTTDCSLREAIEASNANIGTDTISIPAGTMALTIDGTNDNTNASGDLDIKDSVIISGAGITATTIDASGLATGDRIFHALWQASSPFAITLEDLKLTGGDAGAGNDGGCMDTQNNALTLTNVHFTACGNNSNHGNGGALHVNDANLTVTGSTFDNNHSYESGGAIYIIGTGNTGSFTNTSISNNTAYNSGGAVWSNTTLTFTSSTISGNSTTDASHTLGNGGGIVSTLTINLTDSTVSGNTSTKNAGGVFLNGSGTMTVIRSTISGNNAYNSGAGLMSWLGTINVYNSTISGNTAAHNSGNGAGGGIYTKTCTIKSSTIYGNTRSWGGGGVHNDVGTCTIQNTIFNNNTTSCRNIADISSLGNNLDDKAEGVCFNAANGDTVNSNALLNALANNGGPTQTHALQAGSPALNIGNNTACAAAPINNVDQRGTTRPIDAVCDIGAYEGHIAAAAAPDITVTKISSVVSDGVSSSNPKRIPGAILFYETIITNNGDASPDANSIIVEITIDTADEEFNYGAGIAFIDGTTSSAVTLGTTTYSNNSGTDYTYTPSNAYDPAVTNIKLPTLGTFANGGSPAPSFIIRYRTRVK